MSAIFVRPIHVLKVIAEADAVVTHGSGGHAMMARLVSLSRDLPGGLSHAFRLAGEELAMRDGIGHDRLEAIAREALNACGVGLPAFSIIRTNKHKALGFVVFSRVAAEIRLPKERSQPLASEASHAVSYMADLLATLDLIEEACRLAHAKDAAHA